MNRIGLCGYGTVGQSLLKLIKNTDNTIPSNISDKFIVSMIADISENPLLEKYESFKIYCFWHD